MIVRSPCDVSTIFRRVYIGHAQIQEFSSGWGGPGQSDKKSSDNRFFQSSAYFTEVKWFISKKTIIFQGSRGGPTFSREVQLFPAGGGGGGSNCLFPIETHITFDFPGGVQTPCPPSGSALVGFHLPFVSFQYLSSDDVYNTTTQSDSIANGVKTEPEEEAGSHSSACCF